MGPQPLRLRKQRLSAVCTRQPAKIIIKLSLKTNQRVLQSHQHPDFDTGLLPEGYTASPIKPIDSDGLAIFEDKEIRHEILVKVSEHLLYTTLLVGADVAGG